MATVDIISSEDWGDSIGVEVDLYIVEIAIIEPIPRQTVFIFGVHILDTAIQQFEPIED